MPDCIEGCTYDSEPYECNYCGEEHCIRHRLPEKHDCRALSVAKTLGPEFRTQFSNTEETVIGSDEQGPENDSQDSTCQNCNNHVPPERDLCLRCRRKESLIDSKSPDISPTGEIVTPKEAERSEGVEEVEQGFLSRHSRTIGIGVCLAIAIVSVISAFVLGAV